MSRINSIDDVIVHIEGIHKSMQFSGDLFPIISDLFRFIKDMIPLMLEANLSIKETTNHLPTATDNITSVSKTTENATHQVLDQLENIFTKLDLLKQKIDSEDSKEGKIALLDEISTEANEIIFAFQFQDITTQQLEHTSRILKAVYEKFSHLFGAFEKMRKNSDIGQEVVQAIEREFDKEKERRHKEFFDNHTADTMHHSAEITQEDIDSFFK